MRCKNSKAPIKFIGVGEKISDLEHFNPQGFVGRLLGMGDLEALLEKARTHQSEKLIFFQYSGPLSLSSNIANQLKYENPEKIINEMKVAIDNPNLEIIMDRREAIREAFIYAKKIQGSMVIISGKGTDPYIMGANNSKTPWSDERVAREELEKVLSASQKGARGLS